LRAIARELFVSAREFCERSRFARLFMLDDWLNIFFGLKAQTEGAFVDPGLIDTIPRI